MNWLIPIFKLFDFENQRSQEGRLDSIRHDRIANGAAEDQVADRRTIGG